MVTWSCLRFLFELVPTMIFLARSLTAGSQSKIMCVVLSPVSLSQRKGILRLVKLVFVDTSVLLRCYNAFVLPILFSVVGVCCWLLSSASRAPDVFDGMSLPWSDILFIVSSTSCCGTVNVVQGSFELESLFVQWASTCFCQSSTPPSCGTDHPLEFEVWRCRTSQDGFKGTVDGENGRWGQGSSQSSVASLCLFFSFFRGAGDCGVVKKFMNNFVFPTWACAAGFNNNNNKK